MKEKIILAIDMATKTGWACNNPEASGVENMKVKTTESRGMIFIRFSAWLEEMIAKVKPELIVYEQPHARGRAATEVLNGLLAYVTEKCERHGIEFTSCHSGTLKVFVTGNGKGSKEVLMKAYEKKWGKPPIDDNECDARWLLEWAKKEFC